MCEGLDVALADRFYDFKFEDKTPVIFPTMDYTTIQTTGVKRSFAHIKEELFEKIVSIPCWFEYDYKTRNELIVKFLASKNIKTPEGFANILQHSILGFGIFDEYLLRKDVSAIFYEEGEPLLYTENDRNVVDVVVLPYSQVRLAVKNIINMSQNRDGTGIYNYRIGDFWVQLRAVPHGKIKLSISKITEDFLAEEVEKSNLTLLLSDI